MDYYEIRVTDRDLKVSKTMESAARAIHAVLDAENKCKKAREALLSDDKQYAFLVLQEYLKDYKSYINKMTGITGIKVEKVPISIYNNLSISEIKHQIQLVIGFVYGKVATDSVLKETFKSCLKKKMIDNGLWVKKNNKYF